MEDFKFTPQGWHWKITPEQIERIKQRDRDTVNQVYFDNLDKFKRIAYRYCGIVKQYSFFWDCVQQIYVDMLYYDYTNARTLYCSIRNSFRRVVGTRRIPYKSLDEPIFDGDGVLSDIIPSNDTAEREQERKDNERHALELIADQTQLSEKAKDVLTAYALNCLAYRGLFEYEYGKAFSA